MSLPAAETPVRPGNITALPAVPAADERKGLTKKELAADTTRFTEASTPGLYTAGDFQFAVNLDPGETRIAPLSFEELQSLGIPLSRAHDAAAQKKIEERRRHLLATETESRQKLWRNFLLAAVALVLIESWLAGRISRRPSAPVPA